MTQKEKLNKELRNLLYKKMDSFLVEGDKPRPIERLNLDRRLFVDTTTAEIIKILDKNLLQQKEDLQSVVHMLEGTTEREKIINFIKRYLLVEEPN